MSLSAILADRKTRAFLRGKIRNPGLRPRPAVRVPPTAPSPARVGTAFDYALRFGLSARMGAEIGQVAAEWATRIYPSDVDLEEYMWAVQRRYDQAREILDRLTPEPKLPDDAATACYVLAGFDLALDDSIIEIKTVKEESLTIELVRQLVSYALLANKYGVNGDGNRDTIHRLGVYYSRAGYLHTFDLRECINAQHDHKVLEFLCGYYTA